MMSPTRPRPSKINLILRDERGFLSEWLLAFTGIFFLVMFAVLMSLGYGIYTKGYATHQWVDAAMVHATKSSFSRDASGQFKPHDDIAEALFIKSFEDMTDTTFSGSRFNPGTGSIYPGSIKMNDFRSVAQGQALPSGARAEDWGFLVQLDVPLWNANVPFLGEVGIVEVPMTVFSVRRDERV